MNRAVVNCQVMNCPTMIFPSVFDLKWGSKDFTSPKFKSLKSNGVDFK